MNNVARVNLHECKNLKTSTGSGDDREESDCSPGEEVNVPLNYTLLEWIDKDVVGRVLKIKFLGWKTTEGGNSYRRFKSGTLPQPF